MDNGLQSFAFHTLEPQQFDTTLAIAPDDFNARDITNIDSVTLAREYLRKAFDNVNIHDFDSPQIEGRRVSIEAHSLETMPISNTRVVKFKEYVNNISIYGAFITVELDEHRNLLSIFSSISSDIDVDPLATVSPREAVRIAKAHYGAPVINSTPLLYYYYLDSPDSRGYRLAYILKGISRPNDGRGKTGSSMAAIPRSTA
jgi:bacillolysin/neutral peptidase B